MNKAIAHIADQYLRLRQRAVGLEDKYLEFDCTWSDKAQEARFNKFVAEAKEFEDLAIASGEAAATEFYTIAYSTRGFLPGDRVSFPAFGTRSFGNVVEIHGCEVEIRTEVDKRSVRTFNAADVQRAGL